MRYLVILLLVFIELFATSNAVGWGKKSSSGQLVSLQTILKGTHKSRITSVDFYKDQKLITVSRDSVIKLWDLKEQELLKTLNITKKYDFIKKVSFSSDAQEVYVLTEDKFLILSGDTLKELRYIKHSLSSYFRDYQIFDKNKKVILSSNYKIQVYDLTNGQLLHTINESWTTLLTVSPNQKYFAVKMNQKIKIYNIKTATLIVTIPYNVSFMKFLDNKNLIMSVDNKLYSYNFKNASEVAKYQVFKNKSIKNFYFLEDNKALVKQKGDSLLYLIDVYKKEKLKRVDLKSSFVVLLKPNKERSLLVAGLGNGDFYVYDAKQFLTLGEKIKQTASVKIAKKVDKPVVVEKTVIIKKVIEVQPKVIEKKPELILEASKTSGIIPLKVDFTVLVKYDKKVVGYYINIAGEEFMKKGIPPVHFTKTFDEAGVYNILIALKTSDGDIIRKSLTIKTREETFDDFKSQMGSSTF